jgi:hypothetical protein
MAHKIVETTLATALAAAGTLTLSYPSGTNAGNFIGGIRHTLATGTNDVFPAPKYFTLSFGASDITLTWGSSSPTLPVGTKLYVQLEMVGSSAQRTREGADPAPKRTAGTAVKLLNLGAPDTADANGYVESQDLTAAGVFSVDTTAAAAIAAAALDGIADVPRNVVAAWTGTAVLTVTGKDEYGNTMVESSSSGTSFTGKKAFKQVTGISVSASVTALTVGTGVVLGLPVFLGSINQIVDERMNGVSVSPAGRHFIPFEFTGTQLDTPTVMELVSPVKGRVARARATVVTAGTTGGDLTFEIDTTAVDGLTISVANGAAAGTRYTDVPSSATHASTAVSIGSRIEVIPAAAFNAAGPITGVIEIETEKVMGTVVVGNASAAQSATTGDVRGTYSPTWTPDGTLSAELLVVLPDPDFLGFPQYAG